MSVLILLGPAWLAADVRPACYFQDHVVLQRDLPLPVWGSATPGEALTVTFAGQEQRTVADSGGNWRVILSPLQASKLGRDLVVHGENTITVSDVVVGEVWLASGQSNMEARLRNAYDSDLEVATARFPLVREFKVARVISQEPMQSAAGEWRSATPEALPGFGAVAYFFARDLHLALDVPVGILDASWGGTAIESWVDAKTLATEAIFTGSNAYWSKVKAEYPAKKQAFERSLMEWREAKKKAEARGEKFSQAQPRPPTGPDSPHCPGVLYNGMIAPFEPARIRGFIWYQGEANASRAKSYEKMFSSLIEGWRTRFDQGTLPFYWVQLAAFPDKGAENLDWAALRDAQDRVLALPATGQAIAVDASASDYSDIHPRNKVAVGHRLARLALVRTYGVSGLADSGPRFQKIVAEPAAKERPAGLRVSFTSINGALRNPLPTVGGFELAGKDGVFHEAQAVVEKDTVVVYSSEVASPSAVRYAWRNFPVASLKDNLGLPAAPFRANLE